jgi:hypothetical protein
MAVAAPAHQPAGMTSTTLDTLVAGAYSAAGEE